jgi:hypothetical protein
VFGHVGGGAAVLAAQRQALQDAQVTSTIGAAMPIAA